MLIKEFQKLTLLMKWLKFIFARDPNMLQEELNQFTVFSDTAGVDLLTSPLELSEITFTCLALWVSVEGNIFS